MDVFDKFLELFVGGDQVVNCFTGMQYRGVIAVTDL
jgi:hypothetical protein